MTDHEHQPLDHQPNLDEQIVKETDRFNPIRDLHAIYSDVLKTIGAGNAAGVVAAGAALNTVSNKPFLIMVLIKVAGISFLFRVLCFAIGVGLLFSMFIALRRIGPRRTCR